MAQRAKMLAEKVQVVEKEQRGDREERTLTFDQNNVIYTAVV